MEPETANSFLSNDILMTLLVCGAALLAVLVPFWRGMTIALQGLAATRKVSPAEIESSLRQPSFAGGPSITLQMLHVVRKALHESPREACPTDFVLDASRQYIGNNYDAHYARPISMCANILPPIGFIGTTGGLFVLFLSMQIASGSLELSALAMALTSSIFALVAFAILEALKFQLYRRMLERIDDAMSFHRHLSEKPMPDSPGAFSTGSPEPLLGRT